MRTTLAALAFATISLAACNDNANTLAPQFGKTDIGAGSNAVGGVFTETNSAAGNAIVAWSRAADGSLSLLGRYATGGLGSGGTIDPLQSQFAVILSENARYLYAVNGGSNSISTFEVRNDGLTLLQTIPSGGIHPVSLATSKHALYALHNVSNTLTGFEVGNDGMLTARADWNRALPAGSNGPAAVRFSRSGHLLAVTERVAGRIDVYPVQNDGSLDTPTLTPSSGAVPFGFDFTPRDQLVVSEAGPSAASSYAADHQGQLTLVTGTSLTHQRAACWAIVTGDGRFAYTANAGSGTLTGYSVAASGALALLNADGLTGDNGAGTTPLDIDVSRDSRFVYVLKAGSGTIGAFAIGNDGSLEKLADATGLDARAGVMGIAAY
jgi:6-phosphogluconolactonase (cycloisomerase 2 family)